MYLHDYSGLRDCDKADLKGNCSGNFLLHNIFRFHVHITNIYVKLSNETVIMQKNNLNNFELEKLGTSYEEVPPEVLLCSWFPTTLNNML